MITVAVFLCCKKDNSKLASFICQISIYICICRRSGAQLEGRFSDQPTGELHSLWPPGEQEDAPRLARHEPCGDVTGSDLVLRDEGHRQIHKSGKQDVSLRHWPSVSFISTSERRRLFEGTFLWLLTHSGWYKYGFLGSENDFIINNICVGRV